MIYLYGLLPFWELKEELYPKFIALNGNDDYELVFVEDIIAVIGNGYEEEFSSDRLENYLKDPEWIQEKALHHHGMINALSSKDYTVIPIAFGTIFSTQNLLEMSLWQHYAQILDLFVNLKGKKEWNVKIYCDQVRLKNNVENSNPKVVLIRSELESMPTGKQFFMRKRLDKMIVSEMEKDSEELWTQVHDGLKKLSSQAVIKKIWNKELTGKTGEMISNNSYLVDREQEDSFLKRIEDIKQEFSDSGWILECTGPWPPYNFSSFEREL